MNSLDAFWMPFTPNREFKSAPRRVVSTESSGAAFKNGLLTRSPGDTLVLALPFVREKHHIDQMDACLRRSISEIN